jgi:hypothetical protein
MCRVSSFFSAYCNKHKVNYSSIATNRTLLAASLAELAPAWPDANNWNASEFFAFFINAYNALVVNVIVERACERDVFGRCAALTSIRLAASLFSGSIWNKNAGTVLGRNWTLAQLEDTLRDPPANGFAGVARDARVHGALVRAAVGSPNLATAAFEPASLDVALNASMRQFLADPAKGFDFANDTNIVHLSSVFSMYAGDFLPSPIDFALRFVNESTRELVAQRAADGGQQVSFLQFNWNLNGSPMPCEANRACFSDIDAVITGVATLCTVALLVCCVCVKRKARVQTGYRKV